MTEVLETLVGVLQVVKLKHNTECLINVYYVLSTLQEHKRLRRHEPCTKDFTSSASSSSGSSNGARNSSGSTNSNSNGYYLVKSYADQLLICFPLESCANLHKVHSLFMQRMRVRLH